MAIVRIQLRRDTAANWTSANPVLAPGEVGLETDTDQIKIGDGTTAWSSLPYGGIQGPQGEPGVDGTDGLDGVAAATSPLTYDAGTNTVGIDQSLISITASQLSDVTATAAELNILDGVTATATELNYVDGVTSNVQTQLDAKEPLRRTGKQITTSTYTLLASDNNKYLNNNISALTVTVPSGVFSQGDRIDFIENQGAITFAAGAGMTILSKDGKLSTNGQWSGATLLFDNSGFAFLIGDLA